MPPVKDAGTTTGMRIGRCRLARDTQPESKETGKASFIWAD